jgi:hypothetical protein
MANCACQRENLLSDYDTRTRFNAQRSELGAIPREYSQGSMIVRDCTTQNCDPYPTSQHPTISTDYLSERLNTGN